MKRIVAVFLAALCGLASAQPLTSPNLIGPNNLTGTVATTSNGGGYSGGSTPGYNSSTNTIMFGYTQATIAYTYAFSQALQNSGMTITGYNYSWDYINQNPYNGQPANGNLSAIVNFASTSNTSLYSRSWTLGPTTDWTNVSGTETFANNGLLAANIANFSLKFSGKDSRFWAGYYGPQVRNPSLSLNYTFDQCSADPLSSPSCPGYAAAYQTQQCTANPLYNAACPGYAAAYFTQQCNINQMYSPDCPGYASAYLTYQCNANPLYSTTCPGYDSAYLEQQCSLNPLYSTTCTGYAGAYHNQQCSLNPLYANTCSGYEAAYLTQQCTANQLYSTSCPGYRQAYFDQQCNLNGLYNTTCPNYQQSYFDQQCRLSGLYNTRCPNYAEAYATQQALLASQAITTPTTTTSVTTNTAAVTEPATVAVVADPIVNNVITTPTTSTSPATSATAAVSLTSTSNTSANTGVQNVTSTNVSSTTVANTPAQDQKPQAPTARQQIQAKREAAARSEAVEKGKNLAKEIGKAADMESQKQVQNVVIQAMGFTPGFDAYGKAMVPDVQGYKPFTVYNNQKNVDNARLGRRMFGPSDQLHDEMVQTQWELK